MFCTDRWIPRGKFSKDSAKRLYGFGIKMLASSMITTIYNDIRPLIIGKKFSTADLGYYERGQRFSTTVSRNLDTAVQSVMFPVMAQAQDDKKQVRAMLRRAQTMGEFVIFPAMVGMSAVAEPMVRLLLTEKWMPCVIFVQVLCIAEMQTPITSANLVAVKALGRSDILMKQELLRRTLMIIVLLITVFVFNSVEAIAYGFLFSAWLDAIITSMPVKQLLDYGFADQAKDMWPLRAGGGDNGRGRGGAQPAEHTGRGEACSTDNYRRGGVRRSLRRTQGRKLYLCPEYAEEAQGRQESEQPGRRVKLKRKNA